MRIRFHPHTMQPAPNPRLFKNHPPQGQPPHDELKAENPLLPRAVDCARVSLHFAEHLSPVPEMVHKVGNAAMALGAAVWGANKLYFGETALDGIDGVGSLALAVHSGMELAPHGHSEIGDALALLHCGSELVVGGADLVRGRRDHDARRTTAGFLQGLVGATGAVGTLAPPLAPIMHGVAFAAMVGRQIAIG